MGPFPKSKNYEYILVAVNFVSKWVEAMPLKKANSRNSRKMFEEVIFPKFRVPRMVISDRGTHFTDRKFHEYLSKYGIRHHIILRQVARQRHQNKQIKNILHKTIDEMGTCCHFLTLILKTDLNLFLACW
jgi:hypothetical protein